MCKNRKRVITLKIRANTIICKNRAYAISCESRTYVFICKDSIPRIIGIRDYVLKSYVGAIIYN